MLQIKIILGMCLVMMFSGVVSAHADNDVFLRLDLDKTETASISSAGYLTFQDVKLQLFLENHSGIQTKVINQAANNGLYSLRLYLVAEEDADGKFVPSNTLVAEGFLTPVFPNESLLQVLPNGSTVLAYGKLPGSLKKFYSYKNLLKKGIYRVQVFGPLMQADNNPMLTEAMFSVLSLPRYIAVK